MVRKGPVLPIGFLHVPKFLTFTQIGFILDAYEKKCERINFKKYFLFVGKKLIQISKISVIRVR